VEAVADQVTAAVDPFDAEPFDALERGFERGQVAVDVSDDGDRFTSRRSDIGHDLLWDPGRRPARRCRSSARSYLLTTIDSIDICR
jgi:hypothetical protein